MKRLDRKAVDALFREYKVTGDVSIRNRIVENFMEMAKFTALKLKDRLPGCVDIDDLITSGMIGLIHAVESYDVDRGISFVSFANRRVYGEMIDDLRDNEWGGRLTRTRHKQMDEAKDAFFVRTGQRPGEAELQSELGLHDYKLITKVPRQKFNSLSDKISDGEHRIMDRAAIIPAPEPQYDRHDMLDIKEIIRNIEKIALPDHGIRPALILKMYYLDQMTFRKIADALRVSESRICQIHGNTIAYLKEKLLCQRRAA